MILFILFQAEQDHLAFFCYLIHGFNSFMSREAAYVKPRSGGRLPQATKKAAVPPIIAHGVCRPGRDKLSARTCKKLPVASFCASETAETGRIANGREQGDHVSRRQESYKDFLPYLLYFTKSRKKLLLGRAKSCRWQVFVRRRPPKQGELRTDVSKATMFQGVDSVLRPAIQISARYMIFSEMTGVHQVTGRAGYCELSGYRR